MEVTWRVKVMGKGLEGGSLEDLECNWRNGRGERAGRVRIGVQEDGSCGVVRKGGRCKKWVKMEQHGLKCREEVGRWI